MPYISEEDLMRLASVQQMRGVSGDSGVPIPLPVQKQEAPPDTTAVDVGTGLAGAAVGTAMMFNPVTAPFAPLAAAAVSSGGQAAGRAALGADQDPVGASQRVGGAAMQTAGQYGAQQGALKEKQALRERRKLDIEEQRMRIRQEVERVDAQRQAGVDVAPGLGSMIKGAQQRQEPHYVASASFGAAADNTLSDPGSVVSGMQEALAAGTVPPERVGEMMRMLDELKRRFPGVGSRIA